MFACLLPNFLKWALGPSLHHALLAAARSRLISKSSWALLLLSSVAAQGQVSLIRASISDASIDSTFIAEAGASNAISVSGTVSFSLLFTSSASERYRVGFRLLDSTGAVVLLDNGAFSTTTIVYDDDADGNPDTGFPIALSNPGTSSTSMSFAAELNPDGVLDPYETYTAELVLYRWDSSFLPFGRYMRVTSRESTPQAIPHFTGTDPFDSAMNAISTIQDVSFSSRAYLETSTGLGNDNAFLVDVTTLIQRFDSWTLFPYTSALEVNYNISLYQKVDDGADIEIPLVENAFTFNPNISSYTVSVIGAIPSSTTEVHTLALVPDGVQLDSVNETYYAEVRVSHVEMPSAPTSRVGNTVASISETLLHFSGALDFGGMDLTLTAFGLDPSSSYTLSATYIQTTLSAGEGFLSDHADYLFGPDSITLRLFPDGSAVVIAPTGEVAVTPPTTPDESTLAGVHFRRSNTRLSLSFGYLSDFTVILPTGMGYTENASSHRLSHSFFLPGQRLNAALEPYSDDYSYATGSSLYIMEESKPVLFESASISWNVSTGLFGFYQSSNPTYVREDELAAIEASPVASDQKLKRSNEHYYRTLLMTGDPAGYIKTGDSGDARLDATFAFNPGDFTTHFPYDTAIDYNFGGSMVIKDDRVVSGASALSGIFVLTVPYAQGCTDDGCATPGAGPASALSVNLGGGNLLFTADGGLVGFGAVDLGVSPDYLFWGAIASGPLAGAYAHTTTPFTNGTFHMSGHFLRGQDNTAPSSEDGPGVILNSGFDAQDPTIMERPATSEYLNGLTEYPGINVRVEFVGDVLSDSYLAGKAANFTLTDRCKYYVRPGGVTGIHEAEPGTFPSDFDLYNYDFTFDQYGLSHLDGVPLESRTEGSFHLPYPSNVFQGFEELMFTCLGSLDTPVKLQDGGGDWLLEFWLADTTLHTIGFVDTDSCDPTSDTFMLAGLTAHASHVPQPLYGTLGFSPDGEIITTLSEPTAGVSSRLRLPNNISLDGPGDEAYAMTALTEAYFGDYSEALNIYGGLPSLPIGEGKINFAATMDVTFFEDLKVHVQTSASSSWNATTPLYLMGGWNDGPNTFFNTTDFDLAHAGFPSADPVDVYRNDPDNAGDPTPYLVHARQDWLGVVTFDYPLVFERSTRSFSSYAPEENDLLVLRTTHQIDYLSAENAEISVGVQYEGLPRINLASFVINAIDEETGALAAITEAAQGQVVGALEDGVDEMGDLLADQMDALYAEFFTTLEGGVIDPICTQIEGLRLIVDHHDPTAFQAQVRAILINRLENASDSLRDRIRDLADPGGGVSSAGLILDEIDDKLAFVENGIRAVIDQVAIDVDGLVVVDPSAPGAAVNGYIDGILTVDGLGRYPIVQNLVRALLSQFVPEIQAEIQALLSEPIEELNAQVDALLSGAKPTIEELKVILTSLADQVHTIRTEIAGAQDIVNEIQTIFATADAEIVSMTAQVRAEIETFFAQEAPTFADFDEFDCEAIKVAIRRAVQDNFLGSAFVAEVQVLLKQYLYDIDAAITEAVDSAFAQVNRVTRDLLGEALSALDDTINGFLDDLAAIVGAGQIDGFAHIQGDALRLLRLDLYLQLKVPDDLEFHGYLQIKQLDSDGDDSCSPGTPDAPATEVTMGATDVPVSWTSDGLRMSVGTKFTFLTNPSFQLLGLGGSLELTGGTLGFEEFQINEMGAAVMFGATENYLAAELGLKFNSYEAYGGAFFGRTCSLDPLLLVDKDVAEILGPPNPTFTGIYVYGECHIPISEAVLGIPASCLFRISAGVGAGAFYFYEDNTLGGKIYASVSGEVLCLISIKGEVTMVGLVSQGDLRFTGKGTLSGKAGVCPFCIKFSKTAKITYQNGDWEVDL